MLFISADTLTPELKNPQHAINVRTELAERFNQFEKILAPKGFASVCEEDIDIDVLEYEMQSMGS